MRIEDGSSQPIRGLLSQLEPAARVAAFNLVYEGYPLPLQASAEWFDEHLRVNDIRLDLSPVYLDSQGRVIALALLGLRGRRSWIGGFGVAPEHRGRGLSHSLVAEVVDVAVAAGAERVGLEVLRDNQRAEACYVRAGFRYLRELVVLEGQPGPLPDGPSAFPCWQRELDGLSRLNGISQVGEAIFRPGKLFSLPQHSDLARLPPGSYRLTNEPVGSALHKALLDLGWREVAWQREMAWQKAHEEPVTCS